MPVPRLKAVGLQDIADALGISIGTVDRVIHNRSGVNPNRTNEAWLYMQGEAFHPATQVSAAQIRGLLR